MRPMTIRPPSWLLLFGVFLIVCGFVGWAASGFSAYARTAILSGSVCGASMIIAGLLLRYGRAGARTAGLWMGRGLPVLFLGVFIWRAAVAWGAGPQKLYVAILLTLMAGASALTVGVMWLSRIRR